MGSASGGYPRAVVGVSGDGARYVLGGCFTVILSKAGREGVGRGREGGGETRETSWSQAGGA